MGGATHQLPVSTQLFVTNSKPWWCNAVKMNGDSCDNNPNPKPKATLPIGFGHKRWIKIQKPVRESYSLSKGTAIRFTPMASHARG
jgi:hypothetical protein